MFFHAVNRQTRAIVVQSLHTPGWRPGRPTGRPGPELGEGGRATKGQNPRLKKHCRANRGRASHHGAPRIANDTSLQKGLFHP